MAPTSVHVKPAYGRSGSSIFEDGAEESAPLFSLEGGGLVDTVVGSLLGERR
jgi:hypothetical protein